MSNKQFIYLFVTLISIIQAFFVIQSDIATYIKASCIYIMVYFLLFFLKKIKNHIPIKAIQLINIYLLIGVIAILRGIFIATNYWEFKQLFLSTGPVFLLPFVVFLGQNIFVTQLIFRNYVIYALPFSILVFVSLKYTQNSDGLTRYLSPIYFLILFFPYVNNKWKTIIVVVAIASLISDIGARSNMIRIFTSTILLLTIYFKKIIPQKIFKISHSLFFLIPLLLFLIASMNIFNVFKIGEYIKDDLTVTSTSSSGVRTENDFKADTRTFLYEEVLGSMIKRKSLIFGEGATGAYKSDYFESLGSKGRMGSEVGILNILLYLGLTGCIFFTLIFYFSTYLAIYQSNNF
jgi:hypothetical protein